MMCRKRTSRLGNDLGVGNFVFVSGIHEREDRVVYIFLNGIIDAVFAVRRTGTVVIYAESAADIHKFNLES
ncbi:hypothetical protein SDC9_130482 [bioreactor metagenome]|uniref:Uncharacterized protein n=1 Tax=bioreactor metagenome TaxID=1076179 RepID=A0A645D2X6_9ZZZZ